MNEHRLNWYNAFMDAEHNGNTDLLVKIINAVHSLWDLYAPYANQEVFDQESDEDDEVLFHIGINEKDKKACRIYEDGTTRPLFCVDVYDYLIVGMIDEIIDGGGYELK